MTEFPTKQNIHILSILLNCSAYVLRSYLTALFWGTKLIKLKLKWQQLYLTTEASLSTFKNPLGYNGPTWTNYANVLMTRSFILITLAEFVFPRKDKHVHRSQWLESKYFWSSGTQVESQYSTLLHISNKKKVRNVVLKVWFQKLG